MTLEQFKQRFNFQPSGGGKIGIEREIFLSDCTGRVVAGSPKLLGVLDTICTYEQRCWFKPELPQCQIEMVTPPMTNTDDLRLLLTEQDRILQEAAAQVDLEPIYLPLASLDIPLEVYPNKRYQEIQSTVSKVRLLSGCRVAGLHIHFGLEDHDQALSVYNQAVEHCTELCEMGSSGGRLDVYRDMASEWCPQRFSSWIDFYGHAKEYGYDKDLRSNWALIRLTIHGTIEFRMFDTSNDLDSIMSWVKKCAEITVQ